MLRVGESDLPSSMESEVQIPSCGEQTRAQLSAATQNGAGSRKGEGADNLGNKAIKHEESIRRLKRVYIIFIRLIKLW